MAYRLGVFLLLILVLVVVCGLPFSPKEGVQAAGCDCYDLSGDLGDYCSSDSDCSGNTSCWFSCELTPVLVFYGEPFCQVGHCKVAYCSCSDCAGAQSLCDGVGGFDEPPPSCAEDDVKLYEYGKSWTSSIINPYFESQSTGWDIEQGEPRNDCPQEPCNAQDIPYSPVSCAEGDCCGNLPAGQRCFNDAGPKQGSWQMGPLSGDDWQGRYLGEREDWDARQIIKGLNSNSQYLLLTRYRGHQSNYDGCSGEGWVETRIRSVRVDSIETGDFIYFGIGDWLNQAGDDATFDPTITFTNSSGVTTVYKPWSISDADFTNQGPDWYYKGGSEIGGGGIPMIYMPDTKMWVGNNLIQMPRMKKNWMFPYWYGCTDCDPKLYSIWLGWEAPDNGFATIEGDVQRLADPADGRFDAAIYYHDVSTGTKTMLWSDYIGDSPDPGTSEYSIYADLLDFGSYDSGAFGSRADDFWTTSYKIFTPGSSTILLELGTKSETCTGWAPRGQADWVELIELCGDSPTGCTGGADGVVLSVDVESSGRSEMQFRNVFPDSSTSGWGMIANPSGQISDSGWAPYSPYFFWKGGTATKVESRFWNQRDRDMKVVNCDGGPIVPCGCSPPYCGQDDGCGVACANTDNVWTCTAWNPNCVTGCPACGQVTTWTCTNPCSPCPYASCGVSDPPTKPSTSQTCSNCDRVTVGNPFGVPFGQNFGSTSSLLPERVFKNSIEVLNGSALPLNFTWQDGDVGRGCPDGDCLGWGSRTDRYKIWILNFSDSVWVQNGTISNTFHNCNGDSCTDPGNFQQGLSIGKTYKWYVQANNTDCADAWSVSSSDKYVCRPDCRPKLCGQNDNCGASIKVADASSDFNNTPGEDDCYWDGNNNPSESTGLRISTTGGDLGVVAATDDWTDPGNVDSDEKRVYFMWDHGVDKMRQPEDVYKLQVLDMGDCSSIVDTDRGVSCNCCNSDNAYLIGGLEDNGTCTDTCDDYWQEPLDWTHAPNWAEVESFDVPVSGNCSLAAGSCVYPSGAYSVTKHHLYAFRVAAHNVTCEDIDKSSNVGLAKGQMDTLDPDGCPNPDLCGGVCTGTCTSCLSFGSRTACRAQAGCSWVGLPSYGFCVGSCTACSSLDIGGCTFQQGCTIQSGGDGDRDWSPWTQGYVIMVNGLPTAKLIAPACYYLGSNCIEPSGVTGTNVCFNRNGDCWSGNACSNPENRYGTGSGCGASDVMPKDWPWGSHPDSPNVWIQPWEPPSSYCAGYCVDMVSQNNPVLFEVQYEDKDGWGDLRKLLLGFTTVNGDCKNPDTLLGSVYLERATTESHCDSGSNICDVVTPFVSSSSDFTLVDGQIERHGTKIYGLFKVKFSDGAYFWSNGGKIRTCVDIDDFYTADDETVWLGNSTADPGPDWDWKVDLKPPEIDRGVVGGMQVTNLLYMDTDSIAGYCDPYPDPDKPLDFPACADTSAYDVWAFEVTVPISDFDFETDGDFSGGMESNLILDENSSKLTADTAPYGNGDGVVTLDERKVDVDSGIENGAEEAEYSPLFYYLNDYDGDTEWEWVRMSSNPADPFHFTFTPNPSGQGRFVAKLYIPAEAYLNAAGQPEKLEIKVNGNPVEMYLQKADQIRIQVRDGGGNTFDSGNLMSLYPGWYQAINGDIYSKGGVNVPISDWVSEVDYDRYFLASDPTPPNSPDPDTAGGVVLVGSGSLINTNGNKTSERPHDGANYQWAEDNYSSTRLSTWNSALGFNWADLVDYCAARPALSDGVGVAWSLTAGDCYRLTAGGGAEALIEGTYQLNRDGVAVIYSPQDVVIGNSSKGAGENNGLVSTGGLSRGVILAVDGNVVIGWDIIDKIDALIVATGQIRFEMGKTIDPLPINGGLVALNGIEVNRMVFDVYQPVFQLRHNPLYSSAEEGCPPFFCRSQHSWEELE